MCAELSSAFNRTGGVYVFLTEAFSPAAGFLWGWAMFWSMHSGIIAASSVIFARYTAVFVPLGDSGIRAAAIAAILSLSAVNYIGVRQGSILQTIVTIAKLLAIVLMLALVFGSGAPVARPEDLHLRQAGFEDFVLAVAAGLFAFGGWHMVTYTAGETRNPAVTIPRALILGVTIVTASYIALNAAYARLLPFDDLISSTRVAADAARVLAGGRGAMAVSALVIVSAIGVLNGVILAGPRIYYAMSQDGLAFRSLGAIHPRFHTPHIAIAVQALWSAVLVATGTYRDLFTRVIYTEWLFFAIMAIGLLRLRRRASYTPAFRVWGYPVVPVLFIVASLTVAAIQIQADPVRAAGGLLLVVLGLHVYYWWLRARSPKAALTHAHH